MYRLGIDGDGVNTFCVIMNQNFQIIDKTCIPTSRDATTGIGRAVQLILRQSGVHPSQIQTVVIGTAHGFQALAEQKNLSKVTVIRIGTAMGSIPPLYEASDSLQQAIGLRCVELPGGHRVDGTPFSLEDGQRVVADFLHQHPVRHDDAVAITSAFSPLNGTHEQQVAAWVKAMCANQISLTLSHEIGNIGFLERENTAVLNAALSKSMRQALNGIKDLLCRMGITAGIFFTQNNGSIMSHEYALRYPIRTLRSRASNSFRGAAFLAAINDCVMVNVEANLTHIGVWKKGFPKLVGAGRQIAGLPVNLQMPEISTLDWGIDQQVDDRVLEQIYLTIQRYQPHYEPLPILFTGEGSREVASRFQYPWADVIHSKHDTYVSAIGACIAPISGHVDRMYLLDEQQGRDELISLAKEEAVKEAVMAGADPRTVTIQTVEVTPFSYIPCKALRIQVRAIGRMNQGNIPAERVNPI